MWARRLVTVPLYCVLALACFALAPLWAPGALVVDVVTGRGRLLPRTRALAFFALYLGCELVGILVATLLWVASLGGWLGGPARFRDANAALQRWWSGALLGGALVIFSMRVVAEGLEHARRGPLLLFVRHASSADTVLAAVLIANPAKLLLRYVLKRELLWDPCLDIVGHRLPNVFLDRGSKDMKGELEAIARLADGLDERSGVLIYPEGTRFSLKKQAHAMEHLRSSGQEALAAIAAKYRSVLPPRLGGPLALLDAAPGVDVVVLEHCGFEAADSFTKFLGGGLVGRTIRVRVRRIAASSIPATGRDRWLFETWAETDRWVTAAQQEAS